jgi:beta-phosphoglucomutase-like phosphatase (HAD superfamily)
VDVDSNALPQPPPHARALLFDCDGTLVDTMGLHRVVWQQIFSRYDFEITDAWWEEYANTAMEPFALAAIPDASPSLIDELTQEGIDLFAESVHLLEPLEHVVAVAREQHGRVPMAVVTGGFRDAVVPSLDAVGITGLFDVIVTADDVGHSKPAPDVYLRAMQLLNVPAHECVVYEDSEIGIESARRAGISAIVDVRVGVA